MHSPWFLHIQTSIIIIHLLPLGNFLGCHLQPYHHTISLLVSFLPLSDITSCCFLHSSYLIKVLLAFTQHTPFHNNSFPTWPVLPFYFEKLANLISSTWLILLVGYCTQLFFFLAYQCPQLSLLSSSLFSCCLPSHVFIPLYYDTHKRNTDCTSTLCTQRGNLKLLDTTFRTVYLWSALLTIKYTATTM
jgi:hypothetical protein